MQNVLLSKSVLTSRCFSNQSTEHFNIAIIPVVYNRMPMELFESKYSALIGCIFLYCRVFRFIYCSNFIVNHKKYLFS